MGDPRKQKKKYKTPMHPWKAERINAERILMKEYGLKNKKELWKMGSLLAKFKDKTKELIRLKTEQSKKEEKELLEKLERIGLLKKSAKIEDILDLDIRNILDRRLQSQILNIGLARSAKQARQFIVHKHITVNDKGINVPSYLIKINDQIGFSEKSNLKNIEHPERIVKERKVKKEESEDVKEEKDKSKKEKVKKEVKKKKEEKKEIKEEVNNE